MRTACRGKAVRRAGGEWEGGRKSEEAARTVLRENRIALPPAYDPATVCLRPDPATGVVAFARDARGRQQVYYTPDRVARREGDRDAALLRAARSGALERGLRAAAADVRADPLSWDGVRGLAVLVMDRLGVRLGKEVYLRTNGSRGASTLACENVRLADRGATLSFRGKSGVLTERAVPADLVAPLATLHRARQCARAFAKDRRLLADRSGREVRDRDVAAYVRERFGDGVTPKVLRAWSANLTVLRRLIAGDDLADAIKVAAEHINNTPATCRKSYVLRAVLEDPHAAVRGQRSPAAALRRLA